MMDRDIAYILSKADLDNHVERFNQLGIKKVKHIVDVNDENLEQDIGLTKIEIRRLKRIFDEIKSDSPSEGKLFFVNNPLQHQNKIKQVTFGFYTLTIKIKYQTAL